MGSLDSCNDNAEPVTAVVVSPIATGSQPPASSKKRGRPPKLPDQPTDAASWTDAMIETLLEARQANLSLFINAKDKKNIIRGWSRVAMSFNSAMKMDLPIEKIKSKYSYLQGVYRKISQTEIQTTGNVSLPRKPSYYDSLVSHFGGRQGMAHKCLSSSELANISDEDDGAELDDECIDLKPARSLDFSSPAASSSVRPSTKGGKNDSIVEVGKDLKDGLIQMSDRIASALTSTAPQPAPAFQNDLQEIKGLLKEQALQNMETNTMLRSFMEAMMKRQ